MIDCKLFLDDIREPVGNGWLIARSYDAAVTIIKPRLISFDHDLGIAETGYDLAKFIIEYDQLHDDIDDSFMFKVHSANPVGAKNIECLLNNYVEFKKINK